MVFNGPYCSACGKKFEPVTPRQHICPDCKKAAKKEAVSKAAEKRKQLKEQGIAPVAVCLSVNFRDTIKKMAVQEGCTMPAMADKVLAFYQDAFKVTVDEG